MSCGASEIDFIGVEFILQSFLKGRLGDGDALYDTGGHDQKAQTQTLKKGGDGGELRITAAGFNIADCEPAEIMKRGNVALGDAEGFTAVLEDF
jgi:hypothetical protein